MQTSDLFVGSEDDAKSDDLVASGAALFGVNEDEARDLFFFHFKEREASPYVDLAHKLDLFRAGTLPYARIVAEAIDRFIQRSAEPSPEPDANTVAVALECIERHG